MSMLMGTSQADCPYSAVIGALIGVQQGREVEITNSFELALSSDGREVNQQFFQDRQGQCERRCGCECLNPY